jgi:Protein of unknown function (DUF3164)
MTDYRNTQVNELDRLEIALEAGVIHMADRAYMTDARGALVPKDMVKTQHQLEDQAVRRVMFYARHLSAQIARFKGHSFEDLNGFQSLLEQEYGGKKGGAKGNVTYQSFDGLMKVQVQIADQISFGPELQEAKKLIDTCLIEWGGESRPEIAALVNRVFSVEKEGQINRAELFSLLRLDIEDERWVRAMNAIKDSIRVTGTKSYLRFYERASADAPWSAVTIDLASA